MWIEVSSAWSSFTDLVKEYFTFGLLPTVFSTFLSPNQLTFHASIWSVQRE